MAGQELKNVVIPEAMEIGNVGNEDIIHDEPGLDDRNNMTMFRDGIGRCIDKCLDAKVFATCYKPLWKENKDMFEALVQQVMSKAKDKVKEELEDAFKTEDLAGSLSLMDELLKESKIANIEKEAWRPTGDPEADSRAYFMAIKKRKLQELESELQKTKNEEVMLTETVEEKRKELFLIEDKIMAALGDATKVINASKEFEVENASYLKSFKEKIDTKMHFDTEPDSIMET